MKHALRVGYEHLQIRLEDLLNRSESIEELYKKFTRFMIDSMGNLDILSRVGLGNAVEQNKGFKQSSWVPSFDSIGTS